ncbi:MAG: hypothetical protein IH631_10545, partial [Candidatus Thorarchaeota archaeon]|nr:hypothetical protein [Candidatus Thorarchaeota archaeon]
KGFVFQNALVIRITIIERPTTLVFQSDNVDAQGSATMFYGEDPIIIDVYFYESWLGITGEGVSGATFTAVPRRPYTDVIVTNESIAPGVYRFTFFVKAPFPVGIQTQIIDFTIICELENYQTQTLELAIEVNPTEQQKTMSTVISYATPGFLFLLLLAVLWTRHFSIPKRLRQINGQINNLKKGKMPKPIMDSKTRQELVAELFNDTYAKLNITRLASDMPDIAIPIKVPEIRELLIQLSILTHLNQEELDEFNADISKMKMSEQAAFVKEVIVQESIRAARAQGKTVEEVLAEVAGQASRKLSSPDEAEELDTTPEEPEDERVFLAEEEEEIKEIKSVDKAPAEEEIVRTEKLSAYEIDELKADLIKKGVPNHEIDMIIEQARLLSRELVDELVKSLGLKD